MKDKQNISSNDSEVWGFLNAVKCPIVGIFDEQRSQSDFTTVMCNTINEREKIINVQKQSNEYFHLWVSKTWVNKTPPLFKPKFLIFLWGFLFNS